MSESNQSKPAKREFIVQRGFWPKDEKVERGATVSMTSDEAMPLIENGVLKAKK